MRLLRSPLLHFLLLGVLIFTASRHAAAPAGAGPAADAARRNTPISIDFARQVELRKTFLEQMGRAPSESEFQGMLGADIDEEILYREALTRGLLEQDGGVKTRLIQKMLFLEGRTGLEDAPALLDRALALKLYEGDLVVRRILVQKMRLVASTLAPTERPTAQDIEDAYHAQAENLREPDRRSLTQIFFSADRRPHSARADAAAIRARLRVEGGHQTPQSLRPIEALIALGDPFPLGHRLDRRSRRDLERSFGARFGEEAFAAEVNAWSRPIESAYGFHLVRVEREEKGEIPELERVQDQLRHALEQERREEQLEALLSDLRTRYEIVLEDSSPAPSVGPTSSS